ncbi:reductase [Longivirga aurantiaca]|uniref:Reductase n=1 Tax=Longivirga aurantiaca TaxID=1837743 RepID=A0ABW1SZA1_9ACTN
MRLLVLGGTQFVGHAVVADAVARGWDVTVANRGLSGSPHEGATTVTLDRTEPGAFDVLAGQEFDLVADTWSGAPSVVRDSARALGDQVGRWVYVSSRSVYAWPPPPNGDESAPVVDGDPDADSTEYPRDKRGAELALERELGADRVAHLRAGLILGPRDNVGRLPWWLRRIARGGRTLAPDRPGLPIQYVDPRDLATLGLDAGEQGRSGPVDVVCPHGTVTLGELLTTCVEVTGSDAALDWVDPAFLLGSDVAPWTELPVWLPESEEAYALHTGEVARALSWGMRNRPVRETVADCWAWVQQVDADGTAPPPRDDIGMDPAKEEAVLAAWDAR